jgi:pimeloyl-ACP methyl ester carboxylesterase
MELQHQTLKHRSCDIHYWIRSGETQRWVVFLHGAGLDHRMFQEQLNCIPKEYGIILWDARDHGLSIPSGDQFKIALLLEDLLALLEFCEVKTAVFIGQSMGGNLAQEIAYYYPDKVSALVLIDCTRNTAKLTHLEKFTLSLTKPIFAIYPWKTLVKQSAGACSLRQNVKDYIVECFNLTGKDKFVNILIELTKCLHEDTMYRITKPFLLLCGDCDASGNIKKIAGSWADSEPMCSFYMIHNASHNSNQDNPQEVNHYIVEFLNQIEDT